ncbi:MAG: enzyme of heme biosynthesis [Rikenellaceae bacterium]|nr:enzyme of heme biosynthesis [Rikenellaceae bacterium]
MKNAMKILLTSVAFLAVSAGAFAQVITDEKYGATQELRDRNVLILNLLRDAYENGNYEVAIPYIHELIANAPKATENIYVRGANIYKYKINRATNLQQRNMFVDSLMYIYDKRAQFMGDHPQRGRAYILKTKAADFLAFRAMDRENIRKFFLEAIEASPELDVELVSNYYKILVDDYNTDMVETELVMNEFDRLNALLAANPSPESEEGIKTLEQLLVSSGAADCENLEKIYKPQFEADPNNIELMDKIVNMMGRASCTSEFMLLVTESLYKVKPDPQTGVFLAGIFEGQGDYEKSLFYWQESINSEADPTMKAAYIVRAATSALAGENYREAVSFARQVLEIEPENGVAYMIIGQAYGATAGTSCSDAFAKRAAFWLAVDNLQRARSLLAGDAAQTESLSASINSFSSNFPTNEDCFFLGLNNGDAYTVNCGWISGRTTVRTIR